MIGEGNRFAHAASLAVAELPAQAYNPLFLHGRPGLGKTHLLHAIGNYVQLLRLAGCASATRRSRSSRRTSSTRSARRRTGDFKDDFRGADVVLIDDVQFLAGRTKTREEFFHTFNALLDSGRQLVITSDRSPEDLPDLEDRLSERFRAGLVVELEPPPAALRRAILAKRARLDGVEVSTDVLAEIAAAGRQQRAGARGRADPRRGLRLAQGRAGHARRWCATCCAASARTPRRTPAGSREIIDAAAQEFGVERDALLARDRRPTVAIARQVAMYLARELTEHSLPEIGRGIGGRNHTTVLHAVNRISAALRTDPAVRTRGRQPPPAPRPARLTADVADTIHSRLSLSQAEIRRPVDISTAPTNSRSGSRT